MGKQCCLNHTKEFSHSLPNWLLLSMRKTVKKFFQEDACYVIWLLLKLFHLMLNLSQAIQGPIEMVLSKLYFDNTFKEKPSEYTYTDEITHICNLLKTSQ